MKYIIMLLIIIGLALADYITGLIKAYCTNSLSSKKMRTGGLNKLSEIIVMTASCGL
ncbi:MAG: phage holin family protein, partial [Ruminococcus sp.]|nr:phage holin family protein [Ruminococcus sp.]